MRSENLRKPRTLSAFTLLELIIVISCLSILSAIVVPNTIDMIRSNKIEAANSTANQIYLATQNYITDLQIKNKSLYWETGTNGHEGVFFVESTNLTKIGKQNKIIFTCQGVYDMKNIGSAQYGTVSGVSGKSAQDILNMEIAVLSGVERYLGKDALPVDSHWAAQIDVDTYTVDWVIYSDQATSKDDIQTVVSNYTTKNGYKSLYQFVFGGGSEGSAGFASQEYDTRHNTTYPAYVGQYPIPYKVG